MKKNGALQECFSCGTIYLMPLFTSPATVPSCCPFFLFDSFGFLPLLPSLYNAFLRVCWYFTLLGALYKLKHYRDKGSIFFWFGWKYRALGGKLSRCFPLLSFSLFFFYFLDFQTTLEDDNSRDDWINPLHP